MCSTVPVSTLVAPQVEPWPEAPFYETSLPMHSHKDMIMTTKIVRAITLSSSVVQRHHKGKGLRVLPDGIGNVLELCLQYIAQQQAYDSYYTLDTEKHY